MQHRVRVGRRGRTRRGGWLTRRLIGSRRTQRWVEQRRVEHGQDRVQKWEGAGRVRAWIVDLTWNKFERHGCQQIRADLRDSDKHGQDNEQSVSLQVFIEKFEKRYHRNPFPLSNTLNLDGNVILKSG